MSKSIQTKAILILAIILLAGNHLFAQNVVVVKTDSLDKKRAQSAYIELFGPGIIFSGNYDTRFSNHQDGIGGRIGIGGLGSDGSSIFTVPVQINYLVGKQNKFFEVGFGFTYYNYRGTSFNFFDNSRVNENKVIGTMTFGYRYQPKEGGFNFRAAINPFFDGNSFFPWWFGISVGYSF